MSTEFKWRAVVEFNGTEEQFNEFAERLASLPVQVEIPEWVRPHPIPGGWPVPIDAVLNRKAIEALTKGQPRIKVKFVDGINGGIRDAHLHLEDQIVLLDRAQFKELVAGVAAKLAEQMIDFDDDHVEVIAKIDRLSATPIEIP
jgi:hypothetical protein